MPKRKRCMTSESRYYTNNSSQNNSSELHYSCRTQRRSSLSKELRHKNGSDKSRPWRTNYPIYRSGHRSNKRRNGRGELSLRSCKSRCFRAESTQPSNYNQYHEHQFTGLSSPEGRHPPLESRSGTTVGGYSTMAVNTKYGATNAEITEKDEKQDGVNKEIDSSIPCKRRGWWRVSQNLLYGLGHMYNDLCAAMWFSYMMLFFQAVLEMRAVVAGAMLLLGQVVDALATPIVGILADKYSTKKAWHLTGCAVVTCTFPLLFIRCWGCRPGNDTEYLSWWMPVYYAVLVVFFQIGWAVVQISHLAIIPSITDNLQIRSELTSIRYMASVISSLTVYFITWVVLRATDYSTFIGPSDDYKFRDVSIIISSIGVLSYIIFHIFFKLKPPKDEGPKENGHAMEIGEIQPVALSAKSKIMYFLRMPLLYQTSLLYVFSRLYWALSLVYVPLFLEERLSVNPSASEGSELVASVPLVLYISSLVFSFLLKSNINKLGHRVAYFIGSFVSLVSCMWIAIAIGPEANVIQIYLVATLIGAGSSITLVSSLCVTADLIGPHSHQGALIYSIVTFADKLVTGIAVVAIENYKCDNALDCPQYYRGVLTYACGGSAVLGMLSLTITIISSKKKSRI